MIPWLAVGLGISLALAIAARGEHSSEKEKSKMPASNDWFSEFDAAINEAGVKHFSAAELIRVRRPEVAARVGVDTSIRGGRVVFARPPKQVQDNLIAIAKIADLIRDDFGQPITVLNGWRPAAYNAAVGGAKISQHMQGRALDLTASNLDELKRIAAQYYPGQIKGLGLYGVNIHIDNRPASARAWGSDKARILGE